MSEEDIGIIGLGNPLNGDDGIGIVLIHEIEKRDLFLNVFTFDAGTGGMKVLHLLKDFDKVIIIDAVYFNGEPGDFVFFEPDEVRSINIPKTTHDSNLFEVLELSENLGEIPAEVIIMGIQPKNSDIGEGLSDEVKNNIESMLNSLKKKIKNL
ncbi:MAG: hydrogenase maturation protease [Thermoplasmata archaeon]